MEDSDQNKPLVSVVIPVFNRLSLLKQTVKSILHQTYQAFELLLVDDGSDQATLNYLSKLSESDPRILVIKRDRAPKGAPTCRNDGIAHSNGEYLIFWDSDDIMAPWCIESRIRFIMSSVHLDFAVFQLLDFNLNSSKLSMRCDLSIDDDLAKFLSYQAKWGTCAVIWKKAALYKMPTHWNEKALAWQDGEIHVKAIGLNLHYECSSDHPDGIIISKSSEISITNSLDTETRFVNRTEIILDSFVFLSEKYRKIALNSINARAWFICQNLNTHTIQSISSFLCKKDIITPRRRIIFNFILIVYTFIRRIRYIRYFYYKLFLEPHFKNWTFFKMPDLEPEQFFNFQLDIKKLTLAERSKFIELIPVKLKQLIQDKT